MKDLLTSMEAEQAVLGAVLIDGKCIRSVSQKLREDDFSTQVNRDVYRTMLALDTDGKLVDGMLVAAALREVRPNEDKEMRSYLAQLMEITPTSANVMEYVEILLGKAKRRRLREALARATEQLDAGEREEAILPDLENAMADNARALMTAPSPMCAPESSPWTSFWLEGSRRAASTSWQPAPAWARRLWDCVSPSMWHPPSAPWSLSPWR